MDKVHQHRSEKSNFDIYHDGPVQEIYCDGVGQFMLGYPLTKLSFYSSQGATDPGAVERRVMKVQISMPTQAWMDLLTLLTQNVTQAKSMLESAVSQHGQRTLEQINSIEVVKSKKP